MVVKVDDRRVFDRFTARFPVKFKDARADFGTNVFLRDVCAEGAKIMTKASVFVNDRVDLVVELPDGHEPLILSGQIVWAHKTNHTTWDAGIRFNKIDFMDTQRIYRFCQ